MELSPELQALGQILERTITDNPKVGLAYISISGNLIVFPDDNGPMFAFKLERV